MSSTPLISVIVPIYNVEQYLDRCVQSILAQTYTNLEIILVDDGSPDRCGVMCDAYAAQDARVRVIHKPNGGLSDARNAGLDVMTGDYVGFVDSDDWIAPDMYEYLYNGLINGNAEISICNYYNAYQWRLKMVHGAYKDIVYTTQEALEELFEDRLENFSCNKLFFASLWNSVRYPIGRNFEDILTTYKLFERANRIAVLRDGKYYYERRNDSISGNTKTHANRLQVYTAMVDRYREVSPRLPQYRESLFRNIRFWYCHELSWKIVHDEENRELNWDLLVLLTDLIREEKDLLYYQLNMGKLEQKKFNAFAECSVEGCRKALQYHKRLKKMNSVESDL